MPFKFKFVNEITGAFVLLAAGALVAGVFFAGRAQGLFDPKFKLHAVFTSEEGAYGLVKGSDIKIRDALVGKVAEIAPSPDGAIKTTFELKEKFHGLVRTSSKAVIKKTLMIAGDAYVDILVGNLKDPIVPNGGTIECVKDVELIQTIQKYAEEIRGEVLTTLKKAQPALEEMPALEVQARNTLRQGEILMRADLPPVMAQAQTTMVQGQDTLREVQVLVQGLERHWLLRKYIEPYEGSVMISPAEVGDGKKGEESP